MNVKHTQRGFTLIEVSIAMALTTLVVLGMISILSGFNIELGTSTQKSTVIAIRSRVMQELNKRPSWVRTYELNPSFACVLSNDNTNGCPSALVQDAAGVLGGSIFKVYHGGLVGVPDSIVLNYTANGGFDLNGLPCNTILPHAPPDIPDMDKGCPIKLVMTWELINQGGGALPGGWSSGSSVYYPTGQFVQGFFSNLGLYSNSYYGYVGNNSAQVRIRGTFYIYQPNQSTGTEKTRSLLEDQFNFAMIKDLP